MPDLPGLADEVVEGLFNAHIDGPTTPWQAHSDPFDGIVDEFELVDGGALLLDEADGLPRLGRSRSEPIVLDESSTLQLYEWSGVEEMRTPL